jgi:uncharacterized protein YigE (DUF2233 family)
LKVLLLVWVLICVTSDVSAEQPVHCQQSVIQNKPYAICQTNVSVLGSTNHPERPILRTYLNDSNGKPFGGFRRLKEDIQTQGLTLIFAVNGGMYHKDLSAVGYYVENSQKLSEINTRKGPGNFHLLPNGVFYIETRNDKVSVGVMEAKTFLKRGQRPDFATQSGPMLVIDGQIHHAFQKDSKSLKIRNGVGVLGDIVYFVNSDEPVNLYEFAQVFKDHLNAPNALYLDGTISSLYYPPLRYDRIFPLGPIIAIVKPQIPSQKTIPIQ